jgi:CheY-like chemotaxis protein
MIADPAIYLARLVVELAKKWPDNRIVNILCHGHSVPAGYFATPFVNSLNAYPHQLLEGLKERFPFAVVNVIVTAVGGENSEVGAERFENEVLCHRPDVVLLDYALNDRRIGLERARTAWSRMINLTLERGVPMILLTPTLDQFPLREGTDASALDLARHANQVRELAQMHHVGLADCHSAFQSYLAGGGHLFDLLSHVNHPNRLGHSLVTQLILRYFPAQ